MNKNKPFYVNICPDTGRVFICQVGEDNNICEVFAKDDNETASDNAKFICDAINKSNR